MPGKLTITKRATISIYGGVTPRELREQLLTLPEEWVDGTMQFEVHNDQRDGQSVTITINA